MLNDEEVRAMWIGRAVLAVVLAAVLLLLLRAAPFRAESYLFHAAVIVWVVACVALMVPLPLLGLSSRTAAAGAGLVAVVVAAVSLTWPGERHRTEGSKHLLDRILPEWDEAEVHELLIDAPPEAVWRALWALEASDVPLANGLMRLRLAVSGRFARPRTQPGEPLLEQVTRPGAGFLRLAEEPGREIVLGLAGRPWRTEHAPEVRQLAGFAAYREPGAVRVAFNFRVEPMGSGSLVTTETRIIGTDAEGSRIFRRYWCVVYPGSALIRAVWLGAIGRRARTG